MHTSVGVSITNKERNLFYIQQKDELHPIPEFRLQYTFFGGGIDENESEMQALKRELLEELNEDAAILIFNQSKKLFENNIYDFKNQKHGYILYEATLPTNTLISISKLPINEGKRGCLVSRAELSNIQVMFPLRHVLNRYTFYLNPLR